MAEMTTIFLAPHLCLLFVVCCCLLWIGVIVVLDVILGGYRKGGKMAKMLAYVCVVCVCVECLSHLDDGAYCMESV